MKKKLLFSLLIFISFSVAAQNADSTWLNDNYSKIERAIPMRDGIKLFTAIYIPKDTTEKHPFLLTRTPYSLAPYGEVLGKLTEGYQRNFWKEHYIIVRQDVRGRFMSEGEFVHVRPHNPNKVSNKDVDEASDTYDTIEWLINNIPNNNKRVGMRGVSYPGFYATAATLSRHPALKAISPQAPVTDWFMGDDFHHNGALFLMDVFSFYSSFGETNEPTKDYGPGIFSRPRTEMYKFFLKLGPLKNSQKPEYYNYESKTWSKFLHDDTYDQFWKKKNIRPHLKNITVPTLVVGGWFDAENLFGALRTYEAIEKQSPNNNNFLVMGPWGHGSWQHNFEWRGFGTYTWEYNVNKYYQDSLEIPFFNYHLKGKGVFKASEATIFETGTNQWRQFETWPPKNTTEHKLFLQPLEKLSFKIPAKSAKTGFTYTEYISDPRKPVPYTAVSYPGRNNEYMAEDQRFTSTRPDVVVFETDALEHDVTLAGRPRAELFVSTTGTDGDFIVKLIDVYPDSTRTPPGTPRIFWGGFQQLVRAEVMRGKFRNSFEKPEPFVPNKVTEVKFDLNDVAHTFKKGHKIMVQVQSSWFPLVDRNPQKFMHIADADAKDFKKASIRIYHDVGHASKIILPVLK